MNSVVLEEDPERSKKSMSVAVCDPRSSRTQDVTLRQLASVRAAHSEASVHRADSERVQRPCASNAALRLVDVQGDMAQGFVFP